jgi:chromosome partitioning protein
MRVWTIANQKGGVGKTTTTIALAGLLAQKNRRVLMIDLDPHASLTAYFGHDPEAGIVGVYDLFMEHKRLTREAVLLARCVTELNNLHFLPGQVALATLEKQMAGQDGVGLIVQRILQLIEDDVDEVLIDCPPVLGILMVNALATCDVLLVPVQTEYLALQGLARMMRTLEMIQKSRRTAIFHRVIPTMFDRRTRASVQCLRQLRDQYGDLVWRSVVPIDTHLRDASRAHRVPSVFEPDGRAVKAYAQLLKDLQSDIASNKNNDKVAV